jgi:hypothetical protein
MADAVILHGFPGTVSVPYRGAEAVTKSDTVALTNVSRALYVGGAGNAAVLMADGTTVTLTGLLAGTIYPVALQRVNSTNTTATAMVSLY